MAILKTVQITNRYVSLSGFDLFVRIVSRVYTIGKTHSN